MLKAILWMGQACFIHLNSSLILIWISCILVLLFYLVEGATCLHGLLEQATMHSSSIIKRKGCQFVPQWGPCLTVSKRQRWHIVPHAYNWIQLRGLLFSPLTLLYPSPSPSFFLSNYFFFFDKNVFPFSFSPPPPE